MRGEFVEVDANLGLHGLPEREAFVHQMGQPLPPTARGQQQFGRVRVVLAHEHGLGRRIGVAHHAVRVDHQHAFAQALDHQFVDLGLRAGGGLAALGQHFFARQPHGELVGQQGNEEETGARQTGLQEARGGDFAQQRSTRGRFAEQEQRDARGGGERQGHRTQDSRQQDRQGKQGRVVETALLEELQQAEHQQVNANGQRPLQAARLP
ncbi:hypothetical protein D9M68_739600 [compost metagenome]